MTGEAYVQSARIASVRSAFSEFQKNREAMLRVIKEHRKEALQIAPIGVPEELVAQAGKAWDLALEMGEQYGYANCQATVVAPTGTVAFMMDCDTTGVEPEIALVKYKNLSGGAAPGKPDRGPRPGPAGASSRGR